MSGMVVDEFAGPGGWDEAAKELGFRPVGIEHDAAACLTRAAAGHLTIRQDVSTLDPRRFTPLEGLIGSPPCPTFSAAGGRAGIVELPYLIAHVRECVTGWKPYVPPTDLGFVTRQNDDRKWREAVRPDPRSALVLEPLRFALECVPQWIALEQVPDVLPVWQAMKVTLEAHAYSVWCGVLNAADYGVPQTRRRAILMAHRRKAVQPPPATHCQGGASTMFGELLPWVSMAEALGWGVTDLPCVTVTGGGTSTGGAEPICHPDRHAAAAAARGAWILDRRQTGAPTLDMSAVAAPTLTSAAIGKGVWTLTRPATTVCADPRLSPPGYRGKPEDYDADGNYKGSRSMDDALKLSVSDALKLQSFRADYPLRGTKTAQFSQCGNAIPPLLAKAILAQLVEVSGE